MYFRLSRLRLVLGLFVVFLLYEFRISFNSLHKSSWTFPQSNDPFERTFWHRLINDDRSLTVEQRLEKIKEQFDESTKEIFNWTQIFFDLYEEKLLQLDRSNIYKSKRIENHSFVIPKTFEIVEETPVFSRPKFCSSKEIFHRRCPFNNCQWTCEKSSINRDNIRRANVFHHVDINIDEMTGKVRSRTSNDIWILWIDEANRQLEHLNVFRFNWTLSFRRDSEISIGTYGLLIDRHWKNFSSSSSSSDVVQLLNHRNLYPTNVQLENRIFLNFRYRTKKALWFVSNCEPKGRLDYYHQLKRYFPIEVFGSCVSDSSSSTCLKNEPCERENAYLSLFYLAFESQTCADYITEKFWRALAHGMIPIVFGPRKQSYLDLGVPPSAFIHVEDFRSARDLAETLRRISSDYFLYRTYFQWLNDYRIFYQMNELEPIRMCEMCMRLNLQDFREHRFYTNIHQWHRRGC